MFALMGGRYTTLFGLVMGLKDTNVPFITTHNGLYGPLNVGDDCMARIVAISYRGEEPKIGLTMRQPGLGKLEWIKADKEKAKKEAAKIAKAEAKSTKPTKK